MAMHNIPELDRKGLRHFALTTSAIIALLFGLAIPWLIELPSLPKWPWIIALVLSSWGMAAPSTLRPVYILWMKFGLLMGRIMTPLVLGIVFFLVISPVALCMRAFGRDALTRQLEADAQSYRVQAESRSAEHMQHPY